MNTGIIGTILRIQLYALVLCPLGTFSAAESVQAQSAMAQATEKPYNPQLDVEQVMPVFVLAINELRSGSCETAVKLHSYLANLGFKNAYLYVGIIHYSGKGASADKVKGKRWLSKAVASGAVKQSQVDKELGQLSQWKCSSVQDDNGSSSGSDAEQTNSPRPGDTGSEPIR